MKKQIILLCLIALAVYSADQTLAPVPKMTAEEAAETVLADGAIVRIVDSSPSDLRVGDGQTPGGIRVGDGGWIEGEALTRDLYAAGHSILLGEGWQVHTLGGWTALSGGGELSVSNAAFRLSTYGTIFMESVSAEAVVQITRFAYVAPYFELETSLGTTKPTVLYSSNLISQTWTVCPVASVVTNAASYTFKISPTNFSTYVVFRASVPAGSETYTDFTGELRENGIPVATAAQLATKADISGSNLATNFAGNAGLVTTNDLAQEISDRQIADIATAAQLATKADATNVYTIAETAADLTTLGDVTNSYVTVDGVKFEFVGMSNGHPMYDYNGGVIQYDLGRWIIQYPIQGTNSNQSYFPPLTDWYLDDGTPTNLNIKFFSGTAAQLAAKLGTNDIVNTLSGDEMSKVPSVAAVNDGLASAKISGFNDSPQWIYFTSASYTFPATEDGSFIWAAPYFNAHADTGSIRVPSGATNAQFSLKFGVDSALTNSIRIYVVERWLKPTGQPTGSDIVGKYENTFFYTTNIVTFDFPILNSGTNRQGQLMFRTLTPTNGTAFSTNGLWVTDVVFQ